MTDIPYEPELDDPLTAVPLDFDHSGAGEELIYPVSDPDDDLYYENGRTTGNTVIFLGNPDLDEYILVPRGSDASTYAVRFRNIPDDVFEKMSNTDKPRRYLVDLAGHLDAYDVDTLIP